MLKSCRSRSVGLTKFIRRGSSTETHWPRKETFHWTMTCPTMLEVDLPNIYNYTIYIYIYTHRITPCACTVYRKLTKAKKEHQIKAIENNKTVDISWPLCTTNTYNHNHYNKWSQIIAIFQGETVGSSLSIKHIQIRHDYEYGTYVPVYLNKHTYVFIHTCSKTHFNTCMWICTYMIYSTSRGILIS